MKEPISGLHHVTAIASDPQRNVDFYTQVLGLRLVKKTINYDDPGSYHFYFGDGVGTPGTVITFFPWPGARRGRRGAGQVTATAYSIPVASVDYWTERLGTLNISFDSPIERGGEIVISFDDPDGMGLELIASDAGTFSPWEGGVVPTANGLRGFHSVTLTVRDPEPTNRMLTDLLGFTRVLEDGTRIRFAAAGGPGAYVDVVADSAAPAGALGAGIVHHVALRVPDDPAQAAWRNDITAAHVGVSPVMDRQYFHSIYFREPGGVLYEIATDVPGFTADEPYETLGTTLRLPEWMEENRSLIEQALPPLHSTK